MGLEHLENGMEAGIDSADRKIGNLESERPSETELPYLEEGEYADKGIEDDKITDSEREPVEEQPSIELPSLADGEAAEPAEDDPEYDENGNRELTDDEKQMLKDRLGWSDKKIEDNCEGIDKDGVIHYKTDCQDKEGTTAECGVPYERKTIEYNGVKIEGVFPVFESAFDTRLDKTDYQKSNATQFSRCNDKLESAMENNSELRSQFSAEQLKDIEEGRTPRGYTWHHTEEPGKMQLVKTEEHDKTIGGAAHTGGNSIWGNKSMERAADVNGQKGESF